MSTHHTSILIERVISDLWDLYLHLTDSFLTGESDDLWESPQQRRHAEDELAQVMSAYRALGGDTDQLCDARDEMRRRYANV